jgi:predicted RNase H-like nuclease (RuvC/YqgF family)
MLTNLAAAVQSTPSPYTALFAAFVSGSFIVAAVSLYKARPDRDLTVASTAEKQVVLSMSMLNSERERADKAEARAAAAEAENERLEAELVALQAEVLALTRTLEQALTRNRAQRDNRPGGNGHA